MRFEARQERLEQAEAEKEAKRAARKKAAEERARQAGRRRQMRKTPSRLPLNAPRPRKPPNKPRRRSQRTGKTGEGRCHHAQAPGHRHSQAGRGKDTGSDLVQALQTGVAKPAPSWRRPSRPCRLPARPIARSCSGGETPVDAAKAAIEKAMAARAAEAALSPEEKARAHVREAATAPGEIQGQAGQTSREMAMRTRLSRRWSQPWSD